MSSHRAYYSIIQFCPDRGRAEAANVGVLVSCPDVGFVEARTAAKNERVAKFFGRDSFDAARLQLIKRAIEARVREKQDWSKGLEDLERFIATRANDIQLTAARSMKTSNPEADLDALFDELVGGRERSTREPKPAAFRRLQQGLKAPGIRERIRFNEHINIPVLGKTLSVPYAFDNGAHNFVKPYHFKGKPTAAVRDASELAVDGDLLTRFPIGGPQQLIIVPAFGPESRDAASHILGLFEKYPIKVVLEDAIDEFIGQVALAAH